MLTKNTIYKFDFYNLWYDHPIKLIYEKLTLWYNGGMRTVMKDKEELKKAVIESCINGTMTIKVAADRLSFSKRYVKKLKARYKKYGASSMMQRPSAGELLQVDGTPHQFFYADSK